MSIYCTTFSIGDEHKLRCARMKKRGAQVYEENDTKPCTCGSAPLVYLGSHVFPTQKDKRGGCLMLGAIPSHITQDGKDDAPEDQGWHPWLRVSIFADGNDSLILSREQATELRDSISEWLESSKPKSEFKKRGAGQ